MPSTGFEPSIPAIKVLGAYLLDRTATEIGLEFYVTRTYIQSVTHYTNYISLFTATCFGSHSKPSSGLL